MIDVTTTLTDLIIQIISDRANLLDSFVTLYATIVGALHRVVGIEFGRSHVDDADNRCSLYPHDRHAIPQPCYWSHKVCRAHFDDI